MPHRAEFHTPFGPGWVLHDGEQPIAIEIPGEGSSGTGAAVTAAPPPAVARLVECLEAYYAGRVSFIPDRELCRRAGNTALQRTIYEIVSYIRPGSTMSYGQVAAAAGRPGAARAVGAAMARNPFAPVIPCHRVVAADGSLGGYAGGLDAKAGLLEMESGDA